MNGPGRRKMDEIELGDKVRCKHTGYTGIAVARTEFINGCTQYLIAPRWDKKSTSPPDEVGIDSQSLEVVKPKKKPAWKRDTGGPNRKIIRRNY